MNIKHFLFLCLPALLLSSGCEKDVPPSVQPEELVFGYFFGHCLGDDCVNIYQLSNHSLFKDQKKKYPERNKLYVGTFSPMPSNKFAQVQHLLGMFPTELLSESDTVFGCPDCADQGGYYLEYRQGADRRFWIIDTYLGHVPTYLHPFLEEMERRVKSL